MNCVDFDFRAPLGWQCPVCGAVYSPTTPMCYNCTGKTKTYTVSTKTVPVVPEGVVTPDNTCPYYQGTCALAEDVSCYSSSQFKSCNIYQSHCKKLLKEVEGNA